ncbi:MAG: HAMP domain-containing sensor histidine kinase [Clostridia bacterium]|nr:HAMP domain-containing sensor histidine kinase [Clostridia bacterium]
MIKLLKNKEVRKTLILQIIVALASILISHLIDERAGIVALIFSSLLILIYYISTYKRYKRIASLASDINKVLHGDNSISLENYSEGELAILHSEIYKMTVRLREQQNNLINDKKYLADSIADISHQIRTPLTSINLLVQLLSAPNLTDERRQELTHELYGMLSRIDWLITTLLKISKLDAGTVIFKEEKVSLQTLINKSCSTLLVPIELRGQELVINADGEFVGDLSWTCEAVGNIVKNCMEHTYEGGKIEIEAYENALYTEIIIRDNGTGIAKEDMPHIFERFYKGKDSDDKSFGVGLALSRMIITSQKGTVKAENCNPHGAKFTIRFYKGIV